MNNLSYIFFDKRKKLSNEVWWKWSMLSPYIKNGLTRKDLRDDFIESESLELALLRKFNEPWT